MASSLPIPATITANTKPTAASFNTYRDSLMQLQGLTPTGGQGPLDFAIVKQTVSQNLVTSTLTAILFDAETVDKAGGHSTVTNTSRYVFLTPGYHRIEATLLVAASATAHQLQCYLQMNGTATDANQFAFAEPDAGNSATVGSAVTVTGITPFAVNGTTDYVELIGWQNSGGTLATTVGVRGGSRISVQWASA